jgi:hypothetical protein
MKVYVITAGKYSDYHICAVASNSERAELLRKYYCCGGEEANVEIYDTDDAPQIVGTPSRLYNVCISPSGQVTMGNEEYYWGDAPSTRYQLGPTLSFQMWLPAVDEEHAKKIACDTRAEVFAKRFGL